jgi:glycerol-3-phosphate acyltransferase PlsX
VDVVVCDGFTGNSVLKAVEGAAHMVTHFLRSAFKTNFLARCAGLLARPYLKSAVKNFDPARFNGACLIGLNGIVIKSHGGANQQGFFRALEIARLQVLHRTPSVIAERVAHLLLEPKE